MLLLISRAKIRTFCENAKHFAHFFIRSTTNQRKISLLYLMKRTKTYLLLTVMLMISLAVCADDFTLKGKVIDEENNALELVTVSCLEQGKVTMTNLQGEFSISLSSADSVEVRFSMIGYATRKRVFRRPKGKLTVQIVMRPMEALREVTITEIRRQVYPHTTNCRHNIMYEAVPSTRMPSTSTMWRSTVLCLYEADSRKVCQSSTPTW